MKPTLNICSVSGGKDSTALYCLMVETYGQDFLPVFADTDNEHPVTANYVRNLHVMAGGPPVHFVKADFSRQMKKRRAERIESVRKHTIGSPEYLEALAFARKMRPRGNKFLDMMIWKNRAPSTKAQFCTEHLKLWPIKFYLSANFPSDQYEWVMFTGMRAGESLKRSRMQPFSWNDFFDCESVLPMLYNSESDEYDYLLSKGVPPNPLYALGYGRVGCFPCIHANKSQLNLLPDWAWDKLEYWEGHLGRTWFGPNTVPGIWIPTIQQVRDWCKTSYGGRQFDMFRQSPEDAPSCMTGWIECE